MRKIRPDEVTFKLVAEDEDIPIRGNAMASGDDEADKKLEDELIDRLDRGDIWAWCYVKVTATLTLPDGSKIEGWAGIGGCSYESEKDFIESDCYYSDLKSEALDDLQKEVENEIQRGRSLAELFA